LVVRPLLSLDLEELVLVQDEKVGLDHGYDFIFPIENNSPKGEDFLPNLQPQLSG